MTVLRREPTTEPLFTITDARRIVDQYLNPDDTGFFPLDTKVNFLDAGYVLLHL